MSANFSVKRPAKPTPAKKKLAKKSATPAKQSAILKSPYPLPPPDMKHPHVFEGEHGSESHHEHLNERIATYESELLHIHEFLATLCAPP